MDDETEAQRGSTTCSRSHSYKVVWNTRSRIQDPHFLLLCLAPSYHPEFGEKKIKPQRALMTGHRSHCSDLSLALTPNPYYFRNSMWPPIMTKCRLCPLRQNRPASSFEHGTRLCCRLTPQSPCRPVSSIFSLRS